MRAWICGLSVLLLAGCSRATPPDPSVTLGGAKVPVVLSTHCWTNGCADYPPPEEHLAAAKYRPITISRSEHANLAIEFESTPAKDFVVTHWWTGRANAFDPVRGRRLGMSLNLVPGVHTFSIASDWKQGSVIHLFQIEVKP